MDESKQPPVPTLREYIHSFRETNSTLGHYLNEAVDIAVEFRPFLQLSDFYPNLVFHILKLSFLCLAFPKLVSKSLAPICFALVLFIHLAVAEDPSILDATLVWFCYWLLMYIMKLEPLEIRAITYGLMLTVAYQKPEYDSLAAFLVDYFCILCVIGYILQRYRNPRYLCFNVFCALLNVIAFDIAYGTRGPSGEEILAIVVTYIPFVYIVFRSKNTLTAWVIACSVAFCLCEKLRLFGLSNNIVFVMDFENETLLAMNNTFENGTLLAMNNTFENGTLLAMNNTFENGTLLAMNNTFENGTLLAMNNTFENGTLLATNNTFENETLLSTTVF